jgi:phage baseplate assembly protein W
MADLAHNFGSDLQLSATGGLLLASGPALVQQRILRRLLTNPGDYIWQPTYGAGLRQMVGQNANLLAIQNVIRSQIFAETDVLQTPAPVITATQDPAGNVIVSIAYTDATTNTTQLLSFQV